MLWCKSGVVVDGVRARLRGAEAALVQVWSRHRRCPGSPPQCGCGGGCGAVVDSIWTAWRSDEGAYVPRLEIGLARRRPCCPACMHLYTSAPLLIYVFRRCFRLTSLQRQCSKRVRLHAAGGRRSFSDNAAGECGCGPLTASMNKHLSRCRHACSGHRPTWGAKRQRSRSSRGAVSRTPPSSPIERITG